MKTQPVLLFDNWCKKEDRRTHLEDQVGAEVEVAEAVGEAVVVVAELGVGEEVGVEYG